MEMNLNSQMQTNNENAYLELIIGPMFSGKTSKLINIYKEYEKCGIQISVINHSSDNRYDETMLSTHDKIKIPCVKDMNLKNLWLKNEQVNKSKVILINEGQFFEDLYEVVLTMLKNNKHVYVCGLDGDFQQHKIGQIIDLIPHCDKVTKLTSLCSLCANSTPGIFTVRLSKEKQQIVIGTDNYIPVCRKHFDTNE